MINITHGHCHLIHGSSVFFVYILDSPLFIGLATTVARPICDKNHRLAMYQMTVTMYYIRIIQWGNNTLEK